MRALVTGASGFIGSALVEELGSLGFDVHALMRKTSSSANLAHLKEGSFHRVEGDLGDLDSLSRAVQGMDYIFHLAGATSAPNRAAYFRHNAQGTALLAQAAAEAPTPPRRFVYVSSLAAGGPAHSLTPRREEDPDQPVSAYGQSKLEGESQLLRWKERMPISIVRPPMVYGPRDKGVFIMIKSVSRNVMPLLPSTQHSEVRGKYYSSIHVRDLVHGIIQAAVAPDLEKNARSGEIFYLSGDGIHSDRELLSTIATLLQRKPLRVRVPKLVLQLAALGGTTLGRITKRTYPLNWDKLGEILPDFWICSSDKAKRVLGFRPEYDLSRGMSQSIEWYKQQGWI